MKGLNHYFVVVQSHSHVRLFVNPWTAAWQASLSFAITWSLLKLMFIELVMTSNHLILCHPLLLLPSIFPSIRVFSNELALLVTWPKLLEFQHQSFPASGMSCFFPMSWLFRWPKYCSFNISPSNEYSGLIFFRVDGLILRSKGLSRVFSNTTVWRHEFFSAELSLWSNSHIHTWLLEKP